MAMRFMRGWTVGRVLKWIGLAAAALVVLVALDVFLRYVPAVQALRDGRDTASRVEATARQALSRGDTTALSSVESSLVEVRHDFGDASSILDDGWLAKVASHLPWMGDQVATVRAMRHAGEAASNLAVDLVPLLEQVVPPPGQAANAPGPLSRVWAAGVAHGADVTLAEQALAQLDAALSQVPHQTLCCGLDSYRSALQTQGGTLSSTAHVALAFLEHAGTALGTEPKRYLILLANPSEERPGGGFIGVSGEVVVQHGQIVSDSFENAADINIPAEPAPRALNEYLYRGESWDFPDANWSADYPSAAATFARMYKEGTGKSVDGVLDLDPVALSYVLDVLGPQTVPGYSQVVPSDDVLRQLDYIANRIRPGDPGKDYLVAFSKQLIEKVLHPSIGQVPKLVAALARGIAEKHIVLNFSDPTLQSLIRSLGADGSVEAPSSDGVLVDDANISGGKNDLFVRRNYSLDVNVDSSGTVHDRLRMTYTYPSPTTAFDQALVPNSGGQYRDYIRVYVPPTATLDKVVVSSAGSPPVTESPEDVGSENGRNYIAYFLILPQNVSTTVEFDYSGPYSEPSGGWSLLWQKQVNALHWPITVNVQVPGQSSQHWTATLSQDQEFDVP